MANFKLNATFSIRMLSLLSIMFTTVPAIAQVGNAACGSLSNKFGPFDYRPDRDPPTLGTGDHNQKIRLVEGSHFTNAVELLIRGNRSGIDPGGDLDYTLRAFPNHHRALISVMRYGEKKGTQRPAGLRYDVECYFERAIRFRSDDAIVRMIYATYLTKNNRVPEAVAQLKQATHIASDNAFTHYNIGLAYFDLKIYDKAVAQAHQAMALGFEKTELRDLLEKAGRWQEPVSAPTEMPAENSSEVVKVPVADTPASAPK